MKILITGGSGFIGTNLIFVLEKDRSNDIISIDIAKPKIKEHNKYWHNVDIRDYKSFNKVLKEFNPEYVVHLAARTDLNGKNISEYDTNTLGVENLLKGLEELGVIKRVIFTSSMYVCYPGYKPKNDLDYSPHTIYGESKVETEKIIRRINPSHYSWCIIRPTSIWGPWFGEPYINFFRLLLKRSYLHLGEKACSKTYGYVENTVFQILALLDANKNEIDKKLFYLGDWPAYNITEWANEISDYLDYKIPKVPFYVFKGLAVIGDFLKIIKVKFPMTSFRLKNMTTDNILDLEPIKEIVNGVLPVNRKEGIARTIEWMKEYDL